MTLRRTLLLSSAATATIVAVIATIAVERVRARDRVVSLERAAQAAIVQHSREACEANPNWFLAGPRNARPTTDELAQPDADVYAARPDARQRPFDYFAFDEEFRGVSTAAPRFPDAFRAAFKSGSTLVSQPWTSDDGTGVETAIQTGWRNSECAMLLFRAAPPPGQWRQRAFIFLGLFAGVFAVVFGVGTPSERRAAALASAMRESSKADYTVVAPAGGHDELTAIGAIFNDTAAAIRLRNAEIKEQQDTLRRLTKATQDDLVGPLSAVPARIGDVLRSVSLTQAVREQMQAALRDAQTLAHRGANLVASSTLRDRDAGFKQEPVDLTSAVERVVARQLMFAHACGVPLTATVPDRPVMVTGDTSLFDLALDNIIDNAIRYNSPGGTVTVDLDVKGAGFVLTVSDDGAGVSDARLKYLNGVRRFRGDERRNTRADEVGLGLAIVHEVTGRAKIALAFRRRDNGGLEVKLSA